MELVEGVGEGRGGGVVAGEEEGFHLVDDQRAEGRVHLGGGAGRAEFFLVRVDCDVDDGAGAGLLFLFNGAIRFYMCRLGLGLGLGFHAQRVAPVELFADRVG